MRNPFSDLGIDEDRILQDEPMARHTSFRIGGPAAWFVTVINEEELSAVLRYLTENEIRHMLVGNGSNLLFADAGYDGVVVRLGGEFQDAAVTGGVLAAGGACLLSRAAAAACEHGLAGLEFASGIPGSVGGALYMNAGAYGGEIKDVCVRARLMTPDGTAVYECDAADLAFAYRNSALQQTGEIVLRADFALTPDDPAAIQARMQDLNERRTSKQPLNYPSAGSTFKRPVGGFAAALIDQAGLKGTRVGGAMVSDKHAGFVINVGGATAADVLELMQIVSDRVYEMSGIRLEPEVRIIP
ncbi:MAG: UDP-N-acetylmuramate dehydrogenase [Mogibacterium sp.]|nr:UDP-N-acetylmuramate dehydrogenase [Mogibacterium sp.]